MTDWPQHSRRGTDRTGSRTLLRSTRRLAAVLGVLVLATVPTAAADRLFVSVFSGGTIERFDLPSTTSTEIVSGLDHPEDGACGPDGLIYFAESLIHQITRWDQDGLGSTNIVPSAGSVFGPEGLAFDSAGDLFFNTREIGSRTMGAFRIRDADPAMGLEQIVTPYTTFGEGTDVILAGPHAGGLLLAARGEARVWLSEPPGAPLELFIDTAAFPSGSNLFAVTSNGCGEVFVSFAPPNLSVGPSEVYRFDEQGKFIEVYADGFVKTAFMEFDSAGDLYVADSGGGSIYRIEPDKSKNLFASVPGGPTGMAMCRDSWVPSCGLTCDAGGPYLAECEGPVTCIDLDGSGSSQAGGDPLSYSWQSECPGASFSDPTVARPTLCIDTAATGCGIACNVTLTVTSGASVSSCRSDVVVTDSEPPDIVGCMLRPLPPRSASSAGSPSSPRAPRSPRSPRSPSSATSGASSAIVEVECGAAADSCDPDLSVTARVIVTRHVIEAGTCVVETESTDVSCGEVLELHHLAPPCPARPASSARPAVSVRSSGIRVIRGEEIRLEVTATDSCGLIATCVDVATAPGGAVPAPSSPAHCPVPVCGDLARFDSERLAPSGRGAATVVPSPVAAGQAGLGRPQRNPPPRRSRGTLREQQRRGPALDN